MSPPSCQMYSSQPFIEVFVRSIRDGTPPVADADDGRWAVLMCLAAQRSVDSGRPVEIAELET